MSGEADTHRPSQPFELLKSLEGGFVSVDIEKPIEIWYDMFISIDVELIFCYGNKMNISMKLIKPAVIITFCLLCLLFAGCTSSKVEEKQKNDVKQEETQKNKKKKSKFPFFFVF